MFQLNANIKNPDFHGRLRLEMCLCYHSQLSALRRSKTTFHYLTSVVAAWEDECEHAAAVLKSQPPLDKSRSLQIKSWHCEQVFWAQWTAFCCCLHGWTAEVSIKTEITPFDSKSWLWPCWAPDRPESSLYRNRFPMLLQHLFLFGWESKT